MSAKSYSLVINNGERFQILKPEQFGGETTTDLIVVEVQVSQLLRVLNSIRIRQSSGVKPKVHQVQSSIDAVEVKLDRVRMEP